MVKASFIWGRIITYIFDGNTINGNLNSVAYRPRYIDMDPSVRCDYFFSEATEVNLALMEGQQMVLTKMSQKPTGTAICCGMCIWKTVPSSMQNWSGKGYAVIATFPPDVLHQALFLELEREAREAGQGLGQSP